MKVLYDDVDSRFVWKGRFEDRAEPHKAGFTWSLKRNRWESKSPYPALALVAYAEGEALNRLLPLEEAIEESFRDFDPGVFVPAPQGLEYLPFQKAGILYASRYQKALIADQPGLGKTIQAIGVANYLGLKRLLIICPASVRISWKREIEKWHLLNPGVKCLFSRKDTFNETESVVMSYDLAVRYAEQLTGFDLVVADEAHYLKNFTSQRSKELLKKGRIAKAAERVLFLTGTPSPNNPASELYALLRHAAFHVIDHMSYNAYINRFVVITSDSSGRVIFGKNKRPEELSNRLRSGFMIRRLKKDVLKQLPDKQYNLVVFEAKSKAIKDVLKREKDFSAEEIIRKGVPVGTALPEIRKAMGIAKIPQVVEYVQDLLDGGVEKVAVFGYHVDVVNGIANHFKTVRITGNTSATARQDAIDRFMNDESCKVFVGNLIAGGVGITLTSACDVVLAEPSWVPGDNEQAVDRLHRIGQTRKVTVHTLVVEGSLDATILGSAANKRYNINEVIGG